MAIREILSDRDPALHKKCHLVTEFDGKLASLLDDMKDTQEYADFIASIKALAAV